MESKEGGYWICRHAEHDSLMEIFAAGELEKFDALEGGYIRIAWTDTYEAALERVESIIMEICQRDPTMQNAKEQIKTLYQ